MAEFKTKDRDVQRLSVGAYDLDVNDGVVDLSGLDEDDLRVLEFELSSLSLVDRDDDEEAARAAFEEDLKGDELELADAELELDEEELE